MLLPFRTSLCSISLQRGSENLDDENPEETSFKQLLSCNVQLQLHRTSALSFKQLKFHKIAQRQLHSPSRDCLRQIRFTLNQAAHKTRRQCLLLLLLLKLRNSMPEDDSEPLFFFFNFEPTTTEATRFRRLTSRL